MQEGAGGGAMLVYPQRRPSAMRFTVPRASSCKGTSTSISSFLSGRAIERHSPTDSGWVGFFFSGASSFRQFSMRRAAKRKKRVSHLMVTKYIQLVLKSARQTPSHLQETSAFPRLKEGPSDCRGLEEQRKT